MDVPVVTAFTPEALELLIRNVVPAVRIRNAHAFRVTAVPEQLDIYPAAAADGALQATDTYCDGQTLNRYYAQIHAGTDWSAYGADRRTRDAQLEFDARVAAVERLLNSAWRYGVGGHTVGDTPLRRGIMRVNLARSPCPRFAVLPHVDVVPSDIVHVARQFSCNLYLALPEHGGELLIWPVLEQFVHMSLGPDNKIDPERLPPPIIVKPEAGDAIILNSRTPHAVAGFEGGVRATHSCFLGFSSQEPAMMWA